MTRKIYDSNKPKKLIRDNNKPHPLLDIIKNKKLSQGISTKIKQSSKIYIDVSVYHNWTYSVKTKKFTNTLKDDKEAAQNFYFILHDIFYGIQRTPLKNFSNGQFCGHYHILKNEQRKIAVEVIKKIHDIDVESEVNLYQIGAENNHGIRLIGSIIDNIFYPLFIDHHHLLYPSQHYNDKDIKHYNEFPQNDYK